MEDRKGSLPKVLVVGKLNDKQKGTLSRLIQLENEGKCIIEYTSGRYPAIIFDPKEIKL